MIKTKVVCNLDEFIRKHNETYINYFECILSPEGELTYAVPSHQISLFHIYRRRHGLSDEQLWDIIPVDANVMVWLVEKTGYVSLWSCGYIAPKQMTDEQKSVVERLISCGLIEDSKLTYGF